MIRRLSRLVLLGLSVVSILLTTTPTLAQAEEFSSYSARSELAEAHADVFRLYWAFFDREPDVSGAQYWVGQHDQCASLLDITWSFSNSTEFVNRYGSLSNEEYVNLVYANVLDRAPDEQGKRYWLSLLDSGELIQADVMLYFSLGQEFKRRHPLPSDGRAYAGCSKPAPDPAPQPTPAPVKAYYANCTEARNAGAAPLRRGETGYRSGLDRDNDGIACE